MSIIGQQIAEGTLRQKYLDKATKTELVQCLFGRHKAEPHHYQGVCGNFLRNSWPRRCQVCGCLLRPVKWEAVEPVKCIKGDHEPMGFIPQNDGTKLVNQFPQECKKCGEDLIPKTWKKL